MLFGLVVALASLGMAALVRLGGLPRSSTVLGIGHGAVLGLLVWVAVKVVPRSPVGSEEALALALLFAIGVSTMRWGVVTLEAASARARCAWMATACLMGVIGALVEVSVAGALIGSVVVGLAATRMHPYATRSWPIGLALPVLLAPLAAPWIPPQRVLVGLGSVAVGALSGWVLLQERPLPGRAWPSAVIGFALGVLPALLT